MKKYPNLFCLFVLLTLPMLASGASRKDPRKPLRYPFGLTPDSTPPMIEEILTAKGLKRVSESENQALRVTVWRLFGQISYENFKPGYLLTTLHDDKLASVKLLENPLPGCVAAQASYLSALAFVRDHYVIDDRSLLTREPAEDALDCGPHFKSEDYELQLTSKDFVLSVLPIKKSGGYQVDVTYRWAGLPKSKQEDKQGTKKPSSVLDNL